MSDPERIIHGPAGALDAELLRALSRETPPAHAHARTLKILGISAGATGTIAGVAKASATSLTVGLTKPASLWTTVFVLKWSITGVGIAAVVVGASQLLSAPTKSQEVVTSVTVRPSHRTPTRVQLDSRAPTSTMAAPVSTSRVTPVSSTRERAATRSVPDSASSRVSETSSLASEVELLDKARAANAAHDPARTLQILNRYQRQFPKGILVPEAQLLRLEALVQSGRASEALPLARQMLKTAPTGPHAQRIIALLPSAVSQEQPTINRSNESDPTTSQ